MTSLPIMWYGCFDFDKKRKRKQNFNFEWEEFKEEIKEEGGGSEASLLRSSAIDNIADFNAHSGIEYDKDDYLENAELYKIGLNRVCFSKTLFVQWIFYALWHALIIFFIVLYCLD